MKAIEIADVGGVRAKRCEGCGVAIDTIGLTLGNSIDEPVDVSAPFAFGQAFGQRALQPQGSRGVRRQIGRTREA